MFCICNHISNNYNKYTKKIIHKTTLQHIQYISHCQLISVNNRLIFSKIFFKYLVNKLIYYLIYEITIIIFSFGFMKHINLMIIL